MGIGAISRAGRIWCVDQILWKEFQTVFYTKFFPIEKKRMEFAALVHGEYDTRFLHRFAVVHLRWRK